MAKKGWAAFPYADKAYDYAGDKLAKSWKVLHAGDQEPFPDDKHVAKLLKANPKLGKDPAALAAALQEAWRAFHRGDFEAAYEQGKALKALGASVAIKAAGITIYTIQVNTGGDPTSSVLQYCASTADKFTMMTNPAQLDSTMQDIGGQLTRLRLTN